MKVVQINVTCGKGSTGNIVLSVSQLLTDDGVENYILYSSGKSDYPLAKKYNSEWELKWQALFSRVFGNYGFTSKRLTRRLLRELDKIQPEIVHLHNLHGHNCNLSMLFSYLKEKKIKTYWTFHDCWAFTGYCPYYDLVKCEKWKVSCYNCPQRTLFSWFFDRSRYLYNQKKQLFSGLDLTIVTPSNWLAEEVKKSFLKDYPIKVIHNGIDLSVFTPTESDFRARYGIGDKYIVLGVAFGWEVRKGLDVFIELSQRLGERYQIVLVGTDNKIDKRLPNNIISIHRTQNQKELAQIYTASDVFANPTREEVLGLVNLEALACGTPVITFNTGGSPECINETCGVVVAKDDIDGMEREIKRICIEKSFAKEACIEHVKGFEVEKKFRQYINLYEQ